MNNITITAELKQSKNKPGIPANSGNKRLLEAISVLYIFLFFYTALSKTAFIGYTIDVLNFTPFFKEIPKTTAWSVVVIEYIATLLLFFPNTRRIGLYVSLFLMIGFIAYIIWMMIYAPNLPCTCGGVIASMTWAQHLIFNTVFVFLALWGILLMRRNKHV